MADSLAWLDDSLADLDRRGLLRTLTERSGPQRGDQIEIADTNLKRERESDTNPKRQRGNARSLVNFGSNDYLGLAADPRIAAAAKQAIDEYGWGSGASPLVTGRSTLHAELERKLAEFEGTEAALLFPSGYAANVGTICALVGKGDAIYSDELNHASIIDGCRLSGAAVHVYRHGDVDHLRELLASGERQAASGERQRASGGRQPPEATRRLIVTDSLFSMQGDFAPLGRIVQIVSEFSAMVMVDEAHATAVFGRHGRGVSDDQGVESAVHVRVGTLSKALGSHGGFVAGSRNLIDWLANRARPYVFSTAAPAAVAAVGLAALAIDKDRLRKTLLGRAGRLREQLVRAGLSSPAPASQIVPVILGDADRTMAAAAELRRRGFLVPGIRPPSVPEGQSLLRISLTCLHTDAQIDALVAALEEVAG